MEHCSDWFVDGTCGCLQPGLYVLGLINRSTASRAGFEQGDQIVAVDGLEVSNQTPFQAAALIQGLQNASSKPSVNIQVNPPGPSICCTASQESLHYQARRAHSDKPGISIRSNEIIHCLGEKPQRTDTYPALTIRVSSFDSPRKFAPVFHAISNRRVIVRQCMADFHRT